jgi:CDP-4-dehydro-6-deoxyglucose reductase
MPVVSTPKNLLFPQLDGQSILDAATHAGIRLLYSCKTGRCSTCRCKVLNGSTQALSDELGLSVEEKNDGWVLSCVRTATTDVMLDVEDLQGFEPYPEKTLPCRIHSLTQLAADVIKLELRLPPNNNFLFHPGQYINVIANGGIRRSYSIASSAMTDNCVELHIRMVEQGEMSRFWFTQAKVGDLLRLNGPFGTFVLRGVGDKNLVFLATGTGIAPVKSMLSSLAQYPEDKLPRSVFVFWGGRSEEDLYLDMTQFSYPFTYIPVLSRSRSGTHLSSRYVQDVMLEHISDLSNAVVYACGSPAMIQSARALLVSKGLASNSFHSDAFVCSSLS